MKLFGFTFVIVNLAASIAVARTETAAAVSTRNRAVEYADPQTTADSAAEKARLEQVRGKDAMAMLDNATPEELRALLGPGAEGSAEALPPGAKIDGFKVRVDVYLSDEKKQHLIVTYPGGTYVARVSGGRDGFSNSLKGKCHTVNAMLDVAFSRAYNNAEMPHPTFFQSRPGRPLVYAIHGTKAVDKLGSPASHGCIRTTPEDAAKVQEVIKANGGQQGTVICVH